MASFPIFGIRLSFLALGALLGVADTPSAWADSPPKMDKMIGMDHPAPPRAAHEHHHDPDADMAFGRPGMPTAVTRTFNISLNDMSFTPDHVEVKTGETVRFVLNNTSDIDHDFTLGDAMAQTVHRLEMAKTAEAGKPQHHHHGGNAVTVAAGARQELIWAFSKPGDFEFDCNIPGHFEAGMHGTIHVADDVLPPPHK